MKIEFRCYKSKTEDTKISDRGRNYCIMKKKKKKKNVVPTFKIAVNKENKRKY